ncbi:protein adenylyltransferase SelO [Pseudemcibacter aquimaris]|uniref:protein adenylyltransferase SelO n=1 Tax=Pseudemcibacter aquimaris TaxID=2857064 RepID=UPI00201243A5|nr:YdiU family protein [Pseudemcibacter aquimaris]MCC3861853.1 YdiU family protein [Pseudemcibacter aquimaris]WDU58606.1 YdiU family protein [Pseudemcibacter aquimaris]
MSFKFNNHYADLGSAFYTALDPTPLPNPEKVIFNDDEIKNSGLDVFNKNELISFFSGNAYPEGAHPLAMKYTGHQFGYYNPDLGDGRGLLMGQFDYNGSLYDLHLKGAGRTPYSRMGDGRAVLRSSIREFLASEALHHLGIPTTRALGITTSDEPVRRESIERATMLMRLSDSHIRFGSFEYLYYTDQHDELEKLCEYTIKHHFRECINDNKPIDSFALSAANKTAQLIAKWQAFGFAHGVLNTDNMSITGHTFDYGPYGFMEQYDPYYICNHSDDHGRYAFNKQPAIGYWNLQALIQALSPLINKETQLEALETYQETFLKSYHNLMSAKIGLPNLNVDDKNLYQDLLDYIEGYKIDYTCFFRDLSHYKMGDGAGSIDNLKPNAREFEPWFKQYDGHLSNSGVLESARHQQMQQINPKYILRNYLAQIAIQNAEQGDYEELHTLYEILKKPYAEQEEHQSYAKESPDWGKNLQISCSS